MCYICVGLLEFLMNIKTKFKVQQKYADPEVVKGSLANAFFEKFKGLEAIGFDSHNNDFKVVPKTNFFVFPVKTLHGKGTVRVDGTTAKISILGETKLNGYFWFWGLWSCVFPVCFIALGIYYLMADSLCLKAIESAVHCTQSELEDV